MGCCSLRVEHTTLNSETEEVTFDFLGKDSIRYFNTVKASPRSSGAGNRGSLSFSSITSSNNRRSNRQQGGVPGCLLLLVSQHMSRIGCMPESVLLCIYLNLSVYFNIYFHLVMYVCWCYLNRSLQIDSQAFKNLVGFCKNKKPDEDVFDRINVRFVYFLFICLFIYSIQIVVIVPFYWHQSCILRVVSSWLLISVPAVLCL